MHHLKWKNSSGCKVTWPVFTWNPALLGPHPVIFDPRLSLEASLLLFGIRTNSLCSSCKVFFLYDTRRNLCMIVCVEYFKVCFIHCLRGCVSRIPRSLPVYVCWAVDMSVSGMRLCTKHWSRMIEKKGKLSLKGEPVWMFDHWFRELLLFLQVKAKTALSLFNSVISLFFCFWFTL